MKPSFNKTKNKHRIEKKDRTPDTRKKFIESRCITNPYKTKDTENTQIISGYFLNEKSYKEIIIQRINNFLYAVLGILVLFCFICYYFVSCKEVQLNRISRETLELNYENEELQNKVDTLQSYYNIDKAVSKTNILERAKKVLEIDAVDLAGINSAKKQNNSKHSFVVSY